eukprot:scaffold10199_cov146-Cylindrotheca_fusiformis.AAC.29
MDLPDNDEKELIEDSGSSESGTDVTPNLQKCKECNEKEAIYQCPGCGARTCSVECVKSHKKRTKCSGKRNRGSFLPLSRMTDSTLRSDYFLLEEVMNRMPKRAKVDNPTRKTRKLLQQCERREIQLQIMPTMMERHKTNISWYSAPRDVITWKVEVILHPSLRTLSFQLSEDESNIMAHIMNQLGKKGISLKGVHRLFMKQLPTSSSSPRYDEIGETDSLRTFLAKKAIIEHPTIYCVPTECAADFPTGTDKIEEVPTNEHLEASNDHKPVDAEIDKI